MKFGKKVVKEEEHKSPVQESPKPEPRRMTFICEVWEDRRTMNWSGAYWYARLSCGNIAAEGIGTDVAYAISSAYVKICKLAALERFGAPTDVNNQ